MDSTNLNVDSQDLNLQPTEIADEHETLMLALSAKQQRFIHLYLTGQFTIQQLAQMLEQHPNTLYKWLKRSDVKTIIEQMQLHTHEMVATQLKSLTVKATQKLGSLVDSPIDGVALQAVKDILDRSGHKQKQEIKVEKTVTVEQKLAQLVNNTILDGEYEVIDDE